MAVAMAIYEHLRPVCQPDRLMVAGSLRRLKGEVGDVELVYVSKTHQVQDGLFGEKKDIQLAEAMIARLLRSGVIEKRPNVACHFTWGSLNKLAIDTATGIPVDLFATTEENFWMSLVIRTGPKESNIRLIEAAAKKGLRLHAYGQYTKTVTGQVVPCGSEEEVFLRAGLPCLKPQDR